MQELLGDTSITMTLDIYSHVLPDTKAAEIQKVQICFKRKPPAAGWFFYIF